MTVLGADLAIDGVEDDEVARLDLGRADAEPHRARVEPVEVDETAEQGLERRDVVEAQLPQVAGGQHQGRRNARLEEAGSAPQQRADGAALIEELMKHVVPDFARDHIRGSEWPLRDGFPERAQPFDPPLRRVAGDQGRVDGADRDAGDPMRMKVRLRQRLVDTALVGPESATALQQQRDTLEIGTDG
jgi:hypothetical protein